MFHIYNKIQSKISAIVVAFDAGARAEGNKYSLGTAHMLEHMIFKGTSKRTYLEIPKEIAFLGGSANAFTSQEYVGFYIILPYENLEKGMEILSDMVFNSALPEKEFLKEREVVKEEELSSNDNVDSFIWDNFNKEFFGNRIAHPVIGTQDTISNFSVKELSKFYKKYYRKSNAIVSLCSRHSKRDAKRLLTKYFGRSTGKISHDVEIFSPIYREARKVEITRPKLEHTYVLFCYPGKPIGSPNEAAEGLMLSILGQGMDSRLFSEIRENHGLCYSIDSSGISYRDYSSVLISTSTRLENVEEMASLIDKEVSKMKNSLITDEELERALNKYRADFYAITERSYSMAKINLSRSFYGLGTFEQLMDEANNVTAEDIRAVANEIFDESKKLTLICKEG